ncbi:short-chain dehydrogenase/reductase SDR [Oceaniovalibus guishaninsula JLT2003]|uniref:Short-chain dehydrogenase/reductase SDR n=1 Tax=Oceaniovalibus guishaninsula JLT2003 TaxID=1231392 RepID=K2HLY4_9RHOB|nr:SDR family NAD(P)-dependent oxidoreductase [Oceaniovalibus guishaninsula]EKE43899.1 short-chain dehydrogenase/reductase SDR [Oceaniovalibus guishaninsula JLT2003]
MKRALVIGATGGIGGAVARELDAQGAEVTGRSRADGLDVTDEESVARNLGDLDGPFDLIFVATGALTNTRGAPEKSLRDLGAEEVLAQMALNAVGPALVLKHALRLLPRDRRSVFAALSARVGSIGDNRLGGWYSYRASKAALNALIHGASIEVARSHRHAVLACLHPGTVSTAFTGGFPDHDKVSPEIAARNLLDVCAGLTPAQSGGFFDYAGREVVW